MLLLLLFCIKMKRQYVRGPLGNGLNNVLENVVMPQTGVPGSSGYFQIGK